MAKFLVVGGLLSVGGATGSRHADNNRMTIEMGRHSFSNSIPLDRVGKDQDWFLNGAALPTLPQHVLLTPGVQDRFGQVFAREAIDSRDFDLSVDLKLEGHMMRGQGFALWYGQEDFPAWFDSLKFYGEYKADNKEADFEALLKKNGLTLYGFKEKFNGFGVTFTERNGKANVHCVEDDNRGKTRSTLESKRPNQILDLNNKELTVIVQRQPGGKVSIKTKVGHEAETDLCEMGTGGLMAGSGYLGITSYSGKGRPGEEAVEPATLGMTRIKAVNHDEHHLGDKTLEQYEGLKDVMKDQFNYTSQQNQTEAIDRLEKLLEVFASGHKDQKLLTRLGELGDKTSALESTVKTFRQEVRIVLGHKKQESMQELKSKMRGLKSLINHSSRDHETQVDSARTKALKAMASMESPSNTKSVERFHESLEKIRNGTSGLMYMFGLIIFAITATTLLLWNKMRSYEKKHFL
mmetsp:Transcript_16370/g.40385  ORF Transcript_16370/g.40385 Transcript_16370/m.40385 type:complete len:464 (-) Transcript_16370:980-2371(-)|eukprot:g16756.t1